MQFLKRIKILQVQTVELESNTTLRTERFSSKYTTQPQAFQTRTAAVLARLVLSVQRAGKYLKHWKKPSGVESIY